MDGLRLLEDARAAGLTVEVDGNRLVVWGPKSAEKLAHRLLRNKAHVLAALGFAGWVRRPDTEAATEPFPPAPATHGQGVPEEPSSETFTLDGHCWTVYRSVKQTSGRIEDVYVRDDYEGPPPEVDLDHGFEEPGEPCPECGSLDYWENVLGERFCQQCRPSGRSGITARKARRLREQANQRHSICLSRGERRAGKQFKR